MKLGLQFHPSSFSASIQDAKYRACVSHAIDGLDQDNYPGVACFFNLSAHKDLSNQARPTAILLVPKAGNGWSRRQVEPMLVKGGLGK